jgi:hypothetical protein
MLKRFERHQLVASRAVMSDPTHDVTTGCQERCGREMRPLNAPGTA